MTKAEADAALGRAAEADAAKGAAKRDTAKMKAHWKLHGFYGVAKRGKGRGASKEKGADK